MNSKEVAYQLTRELVIIAMNSTESSTRLISFDEIDSYLKNRLNHPSSNLKLEEFREKVIIRYGNVKGEDEQLQEQLYFGLLVFQCFNLAMSPNTKTHWKKVLLDTVDNKSKFDKRKREEIWNKLIKGIDGITEIYLEQNFGKMSFQEKIELTRDPKFDEIPEFDILREMLDFCEEQINHDFQRGIISVKAWMYWLYYAHPELYRVENGKVETNRLLTKTVGLYSDQIEKKDSSRVRLDFQNHLVHRIKVRADSHYLDHKTDDIQYLKEALRLYDIYPERPGSKRIQKVISDLSEK